MRGLRRRNLCVCASSSLNCRRNAARNAVERHGRSAGKRNVIAAAAAQRRRAACIRTWAARGGSDGWISPARFGRTDGLKSVDLLFSLYVMLLLTSLLLGECASFTHSHISRDPHYEEELGEGREKEAGDILTLRDLRQSFLNNISSACFRSIRQEREEDFMRLLRSEGRVELLPISRTRWNPTDRLCVCAFFHTNLRYNDGKKCAMQDSQPASPTDRLIFDDVKTERSRSSIILASISLVTRAHTSTFWVGCM